MGRISKVQPQQIETTDMEVRIHQPSHKFLFYSALTDVGHGEYIEANIKIPEESDYFDFQLALYSHASDKGHTHLLFISPNKKDGFKIKKKSESVEPTPDNYHVDFKFSHENNYYFIDVRNHPYLESFGGDAANRLILGPESWNPETREIFLGKGKLQLTVQKAIQKSQDNKSSIHTKIMKEIRGIKEDFQMDYNQVRLGVKLLEDPNIIYSKTILYDKATFAKFEIYDIYLATNPEDKNKIIILLKNTPKLTNDFTKKMTITYPDQENEVVMSPEKAQHYEQ